jgi:hypothetical protein
MKPGAASAGFYESPGWGKKYPRIQILTVAELLAGRDIEMPPLRLVSQTFRKAPRADRSEYTEGLPRIEEEAVDAESTAAGV